jgi:hypothetical protein
MVVGMKEWHPPSFWHTKRRAAHKKSIDFLRSIVEQSPRMEFPTPEASIPNVLVCGASRRWYKIEIMVHYDTVEIGGIGSVDDVVWNLHVSAGAWKQDVVDENLHSVSICIGPRKEAKSLPVGDQIAALALSLLNDKTTAMRLPLLAQFIVSPRKALKDVYQFSQEGVIMEDDMFWMPDVMEDQAEVEQQEELAAFDEAFENILTLMEHDENQALNQWFSATEDAVVEAERSTPWHHDEDRVWQMEDNLRKGRT